MRCEAMTGRATVSRFAAKGEALPYHSVGQRPTYGCAHPFKAEGLALLFAVVIAALAGAAEMAPVRIALPAPAKWPGSLGEIKEAKNLEPPRDGKPRPQILAPQGCGELLSGGCRVTSSDAAPVTGDLSFVTDGKKEEAADENVRLVLRGGPQWVQIDLGASKEIHAVCLWHSFSPRIRVYHDVVVQVSDDPDFMEGVVTLFNNDHDNSSGLGAGKDFEYVETHEGRPIAAGGVKGRYVRCHSNGNIRDASNAYVQVEVFGRK